jgi:hypothetical protein
MKMMNHKLRVLVRLDLDGVSANIEVRGNVTHRSIQALYVVAKRVNSLLSNMALVFDLSHAHVEPEALAALHSCSRTRHLPAAVDPEQSNYRLRIIKPNPAFELAA